MSSSASKMDQEGGPWRSFVIMSGYHDYRSKRRVDLHFIADELKKRGEVSFISLRYSYLTRYKEDPRHDLWNRANKIETVNGVDCYLWRTPVHPFRLPQRLALIETAVFTAFASYLPRAVRALIQRAEIVLVESGMSIIYIPLIKRLNPNVRIIYLASDSLDAIGQAGAIKRALKANASLIDSARLPSPYLAAEMPRQVPCYYIPHGIDTGQLDRIGPSPFPPGSLNAVSVGSMLFDPAFFEAAAELFPNITFHVIGSGHANGGPANISYYPEMPFEKTLPYLKHSAFAVAAYGKGLNKYLVHTSMKMMQYNYLAVPAVCPQEVAGDGMGRFGYRRDDRESIREAIGRALASPQIVPRQHMTWTEVTDRLLKPGSNPNALFTADTWLPARRRKR